MKLTNDQVSIGDSFAKVGTWSGDRLRRGVAFSAAWDAPTRAFSGRRTAAERRDADVGICRLRSSFLAARDRCQELRT
jgi:hypothetical protein